jgi:amino acid adenylation domain-containing protein
MKGEGNYVSGSDLKPGSFVDLLRWRGVNQVDKRAFTFLGNGETEAGHLCFGELDRRARAIGARLQAQNARGARVLLLFPSGLDYIAAICGCLYAGAIAVPVPLPQLSQSLQRIQAIARNSEATCALTTSLILASVKPLITKASELVELESLKWLAVDTSESIESDWHEPDVAGDTVAFLQYTSGSTGRPKGVIINHNNLLQQSYQLSRIFLYEAKTSCVTWVPMYHNSGLFGVVLQVIYGGFPAAFMPPISFLERPARWLEAITRYKATVSAGPNFAYDLCVSQVPQEIRETLDLSSWDTAVNSSEPIRTKTLDRFVEAFGPCGFRREAFFPCYGLTESTLIVSGGPKWSELAVQTVKTAALENNLIVEASREQNDVKELVSSGQVLPSEKVIIVNPETLAECAPREVGEIWVKGPCVAQGYWHRPNATEDTFHCFLANTGEGPFLRTGDLGYLQDRQVFVTGRLKDLIIVRGRNHYPQDIELTVAQCHVSLRPGFGAAFSVEEDDEERLVVVQEVKIADETKVPEVIEAIRQAIARAHGIQVYGLALVEENSILKTYSGKIQRSACRAAYLNQSLAVLKEWHLNTTPEQRRSPAEFTNTERTVEEVESWLTNMLASKIGIEASQIDRNRPITQYGLDSIGAIELMHGIETSLGTRLPMWSLLQGPSIAELSAQTVARDNGDGSTGFARTSTELAANVYPLSHGQQALWFLNQMAPESAAYNVWGAARIRADLDTFALRESYQTLVDRHASLRITFTSQNGEPVQQVHGRMDIWFREEDASNWSEAALNERLSTETRRPFNLEQGPLMRVYLFRRSEREYLLLWVIHHIVTDLWSLVVLTDELATLYPANRQGVPAKLQPVELDYSDFVRWQTALLEGQGGEQLWSYWKKELAGELPILNLPTDRPHPPLQTYEGAAHYFQLNSELTEQIKEAGRAQNATPYMTLLAAFQLLLHRYSGQDDIIVGSPMIGRNHPELARIVGLFVNPLPMRADFSGDPTFEEFLVQMRETALGAFEHQDYPFSLLAARLQPERSLSRPPIFQVMFVFQKPHLLSEEGLAALSMSEAGGQLQLGDLTLQPIALERRIAQFDLTLTMAELDGQLRGLLEYNSDLFDAATVRRFSENFRSLLQSIVNNPRQRVSTLQFLSEQEQRQLLLQWNDTVTDYPRMACLHELFEAQAGRTPESRALVFEDTEVSYRELNRRANQLAHRLRSMGVGAEALVGICVERGIEMIIGMLGILKAGGAYVPLDPHYPQERLRFMLEDSQVRVLLTQQHLVETLPQHQTQVLCLDADWSVNTEHSAENPERAASADNLAYVIYTSGSTGQPKGVAIAHQSAVALVTWARTVFRPDDLAGMLASTSICFDLSVFEIFVTLASGGTVIVAENALQVPSLPAAQTITLINTVPSAMTELLRIAGVPKSVRIINLAGEPLTKSLVEQTYQQTNVAEVWNLYGPSEDTTYSTFALVQREAIRQPAIGRPIANTQVYLLDTNLQLVAVGAVGELYLGGEGLARGYLNRPELTAERFIPNPFSEEPGARMYRTGDLARYLADGNLDFLGRLDHQVKIRGFRIELGEIETVLTKHVSVSDAVVIVREDVEGDRRIIAYVVLAKGSTCTVDELYGFLKKRLPDHMVPAGFLLLESLPLTPNGKVNRQALPAPGRTRRDLESDFVLPRTPTERTLSEIWADLLRVEGVGVYDNFFKLGGHSLLATQLISRIRSAFRMELPLQAAFERPTISAMSEEIENIRWALEGLTYSAEDLRDQRVSGEL